MKLFLLGLCLVACLAVGIASKEGTFTACTADKKVAVLTLILSDSVSLETAKNISDAFTLAASKLTAEVLASDEGFFEFVSHLSDDAKHAIEHLAGPPTTDGTRCKVAE